MKNYTAFKFIERLEMLSHMARGYYILREAGHPLESIKESTLASLFANKIPPPAEEIEFIELLPRTIRYAANRRIRHALDRYRNALDSPMNVLDLDKESEIAAWEICNVLCLLRKHNEGELPFERWRKLWK